MSKTKKVVLKEGEDFIYKLKCEKPQVTFMSQEFNIATGELTPMMIPIQPNSKIDVYLEFTCIKPEKVANAAIIILQMKNSVLTSFNLEYDLKQAPEINWKDLDIVTVFKDFGFDAKITLEIKGHRTADLNIDKLEKVINIGNLIRENMNITRSKVYSLMHYYKRFVSVANNMVVQDANTQPLIEQFSHSIDLRFWFEYVDYIDFDFESRDGSLIEKRFFYNMQTN